MAPHLLPRLALAALAVVAMASCSGDDPESVSSGGGLQLASTTTEQPDITEPKKTTTTTSTTTTSTTSTTTTSTTTTTTAPPLPTADALLATLPAADALPGEGWSRREAPTPVDSGAPTPICSGSDVPTPLTSLLYEGKVAGGAVAQFERADGSSLVRIVVGPMVDASARIAEAKVQVPSCPGAVTMIEWPAQGDASLAFGRTRPSTGGAAGEQTFTWVLANVGKVVVGLEVQSIQVEGQELLPPPTQAEVQAFLQGALDKAAALP